MTGRIVKGIAGFYYVYSEGRIYECKAKGIFRKDKLKPMVGDTVSLDVINEDELTGNVTVIHERRSELIRPAVANVDQAVIAPNALVMLDVDRAKLIDLVANA